jgi:hypothetical protein
MEAAPALINPEDATPLSDLAVEQDLLDWLSAQEIANQ